MAALKVVLDTNTILRSISRRSTFSIVLDKLYEGEYELWVTNDILLEYEGNVHYLVTNDKHFNVLKSIPFPAINVITLETFKDLLA